MSELPEVTENDKKYMRPDVLEYVKGFYKEEWADEEGIPWTDELDEFCLKVANVISRELDAATQNIYEDAYHKYPLPGSKSVYGGLIE